MIKPKSPTVSELKEICSPDRAEDAGTDHKWLKFTKVRDNLTSNQAPENTSKKVNNILSKKQWKFQNI